jgi:hypothetical protein
MDTPPLLFLRELNDGFHHPLHLHETGSLDENAGNAGGGAANSGQQRWHVFEMTCACALPRGVNRLIAQSEHLFQAAIARQRTISA